MKNIIYIMLASLLFTGCVSRLKVEIQIAERNAILAADAKLHEEVKSYNPLPAIEAINKFTTEWEPEKKVNVILTFLDGKFPNSVTLPSVKNKYTSILNDNINEIKELNIKARKAFEKEDEKETKENIQQAKEKINKINTVFKEIYHENGEPVNIFQFSTENDDIKKLINSISEVKAAIAATSSTGNERQRFPILGDELASYIAMKKNDKIWESVFNKTIASSFLGNTDIAMILRSNPPERELKSGDYNNNFTIKGVRMDASDVSNAIINGLTQTVNFVANTQGIPSNVGTTPASTANPLPNENPNVVSMQADKDKLELKRKKLIQFKQLLLKKIELENIQIGTDSEAVIKAKAKRIREYWEGLKIELAKT